MKAIVLTVFSFFSFLLAADAQNTKKAIIKTPTVQCEMCKKKIETYLRRETGVTSVNVDYKKKVTVVVYIADRTDIEQIKTAIANCGYDADDVAADQDAYNKLPKCCKKPATTAPAAEKKE